MARKKLDNPLTSLGIPPKPDTTNAEETRTAEQTAAPEGVAIPTQRQRKSEADRARLQLTTYFTIAQYTKLQDLEKEYLRLTGRKTDPNKILRKLVEKATIEDIL